MTTTSSAMSGAEIVDLCRKHTFFEWSAQGAVDPIPMARGKGVYFWTPEGKRYIDFNSQLMCVNIGHGDERVIRAIKAQADALPYANPFMATEPRAKLGARLAELAPGDIDVFFFTNGGAEANENAMKIARAYTGRHKILARYRSYHGGTHGAMALTGDPRRWSTEPGVPGVIHVLDPYHGVERGWDSAEKSLAMLEEIIELEGAHSIAAFFLETVSGTNGVIIPPDGYLQGVRDLCTKHGILMVCDEVMAGFGRTGAWFAVNHWNVVPDLMTMAKGLTSAYLPLGAVGMRRPIADHFRDKVFQGGLTYNSHPMACAAALATIAVYEEDDLIGNARRLGAVMTDLLTDLARRHSIVGAHRNIGLFGIVELVRDQKTKTPLAPFGGTSPEMKRLGALFRELGLYTFVRWHNFFTNPPLCITEEELREGFGLIDSALTQLERSM
ncbi:MAG TPA: aminotransferase class III-fold pyridoxal phosphate-dependent enzyme [Vicinamibacterales bacterium]|jgi:taurine---2-oxoglutarate transaminase|nr:aminotransferase class III-fold pyridoxal phosphate-dependent enzyme [Vicinamibacterales bacterium]